MSASTDLLIVGAGAKAAAIAAKVHVLNELGLGPITLLIVEAREPAASWLGRNGFTTGREALSTSPTKDVGFPYQSSDVFGDLGTAIDRGVVGFSWQQYLMSQGRYARWVDAGSPPVEHREYGQYLAWVLARATRGVRLIAGRAMQVSLEQAGEQWTVDVASAGGLTQYRASALARPA
jgi:mycobactin lysine-N-oxygenase